MRRPFWSRDVCSRVVKGVESMFLRLDLMGRLLSTALGKSGVIVSETFHSKFTTRGTNKRSLPS